MTTIAAIKAEVEQMHRLGATTKPLALVNAYIDANADELLDMIKNEGASVSDVADLAAECAQREETS